MSDLLPIAKVIGASSHVLIEARVYDQTDLKEPPSHDAVGFGSFVQLAPQGEQERLVVGVVANSRLIHPEDGHFGPRLTVPHEQNTLFAPDYVNEVGTMIAVLLLGTLQEGHGQQQVYRPIIPVGTELKRLSEEDMLSFHRSAKGAFQMRYFSLLQESGRGLASPLLQTICQQLSPHCSPSEHKLMQVVQTHLAWQTMNHH